MLSKGMIFVPDHFAINDFTACNMPISAWDCLWFLHFFAHSFLLFMFPVSVSWASLVLSSWATFDLLKFLFFFFFLAFLSEMTKWAKGVPEPASPSDSNSTSTSSSSLVPSSSTVPPLPSSFYKSLYCWAPVDLLEKTSTFTILESIATYRKKQSCHPSRVFGKDHDKYVQMVACRKGEPVCSDEASDPEGPFCFIYSTLFRRLGLRLPFTPFERTLLTEVNVTPAQLHPNSWAFMRAFSILCCSLGLTPSVDIFLYFFEVK